MAIFPQTTLPPGVYLRIGNSGGGLGIGGIVLTLAAAWFSPLLMAAGLLITLGAFVLRWFLLGRDWVWAYLDKDESIIVGGCSDTFANAIEAWRPVVRTS